MIIPTEMYYVIGGGIAYLILKDVFKFIRWSREKFFSKEVVDPPPVDTSGKDDREVLDLILGKVNGVCETTQNLSVEFGVLKTKMDYLGRFQKEQNGAVKKMAEKIGGVAKDFSVTAAVCQTRFTAIEKDLDRR